MNFQSLHTLRRMRGLYKLYPSVMEDKRQHAYIPLRILGAGQFETPPYPFGYQRARVRDYVALAFSGISCGGYTGDKYDKNCNVSVFKLCQFLMHRTTGTPWSRGLNLRCSSNEQFYSSRFRQARKCCDEKDCRNYDDGHSSRRIIHGAADYHWYQ